MVASMSASHIFRWIFFSALVGCLDSFTPSRIVWSEMRKQDSPLSMVEYEYDYLPPNKGSRPGFKTDLQSVYDVTTTPAGMRGEAVRSAIRSGRCICFSLDATPLRQGWISVKGEGTLDFLNNKLTQTFSHGSGYQEACLLNAKGRVVDKIGVAVLSTDHAYMLTSPGHDGSDLFNRLDPLIFPMDKVKLHDCSKSSKIISLASIKQEHAREVIETYVLPLLDLKDASFEFPEKNRASQYLLTSGATLTLVPTAILPKTAASGCTIILENDEDNLGQVLWNNLIGEDSPDGPIEIGALEFETLRVESGMPLFGKEITAGQGKEANLTPPGPFELHWDELVDLGKGCYLGQEGVASVIKNKRGPPRLLYQVVFDYEGNVFDSETEGDRKTTIENLTKLPQAGADLFVLGSQNEIPVGVLTSVAEPSGTGDPNMLGLAFCRRADSILKSMKELGLDIDRNLGRDPFADDPLWNDGNVDVASAMVQPPPMDPLDGVEVVVKDTYTVGVLRSIPSRRYPMGQNMFADIVIYDAVEPGEGEVEINRVRRKWSPEVDAALDELFAKQQQQQGMPSVSDPDFDETDLLDEASQAEIDRAVEEAQRAEAEADAAAAEARRKADKLEMLKKRAEEAMAKRKAKKTVTQTAVIPDDDEAPAKQEEAKRKEAKMAMLKKRAEEAMARRKGGKTEK